jgi:peptidyl-prolyl cis-trans isomerase B (cyclophilin B)
MTDTARVSPSAYSAPPSATPRYNGMALAAFIVVFFASVVGLVLGYVALGQIKRTHESGRGLALAAVVLGWIGTVGALLLVALFVIGTAVLKLY